MREVDGDTPEAFGVEQLMDAFESHDRYITDRPINEDMYETAPREPSLLTNEDDRRRNMKKWLYIALLLPGIAASAEYTLRGPVTAYRAPQDGGHCHIAIKDSSNAYYSNGIHYIEKASLCAVARSAFLLGMDVEAGAKTNYYERRDYANDITSIIIKKDPKVYWPPYGKG